MTDSARPAPAGPVPGSTSIAAIDAGSNAIRLTIARVLDPADSGLEPIVRPILKERFPVRLGRHVFLSRMFDDETIREAVGAFRQFRSLFEEYGVERYRAIATSASREALNRRRLIEAIRAESGIELEVIDGAEEARLMRAGVMGELGPSLAPDLLFDLGGGSLEILRLDAPAPWFDIADPPPESGDEAQDAPEDAAGAPRVGAVSLAREGAGFVGDEPSREVTLPLGTVRLMETHDARGTVTEAVAEAIRRLVEVSVEELFDARGLSPEPVAVACGGNAEALAQIFPGPRVEGVRTLNVEALREELPLLLASDVPRRIKSYDVRKDRAEVMPIAAIVFATLAARFGIGRYLVPGAGVREGLLREVARG